MKAIRATGFLVGFANRSDAPHDWDVAVAEKITDPLLTCESVLAETTFHLGDASLVLQMIEHGLTKLAFEADDHLLHLRELARRYADRSPDFADLCLVRMSELFPKHSVITVDGDFRVYRRNKRDVIPVIMPTAV